MSAITQAVRSFKNIWSHGDEEDYEPEDTETAQPTAATPYSSASSYRSDQYSSNFPTSSGPTYGGGSGGGSNSSVRRLRPVASPLRAREKNIYTLRPTNLDEASIAADYLKTGSAVVLNLEAVDRFNSTRIIDFMSGVCYGLDGQGHAMKLGETIFLFTPNDFEISSDETDYGENQEFFFKDYPPTVAAMPANGVPADASALAAGAANTAASYQAIQSPDRRSWER